MRKRCDHCEFYVPYGDSDTRGDCWRYPKPQPVAASRWCGEFSVAIVGVAGILGNQCPPRSKPASHAVSREDLADLEELEPVPKLRYETYLHNGFKVAVANCASCGVQPAVDAGTMACQFICRQCGYRRVHNGFGECREAWNAEQEERWSTLRSLGNATQEGE